MKPGLSLSYLIFGLILALLLSSCCLSTKYDENNSKGNQIEWSISNAGGTLIRKITFKRDDNGNAIEKATYAEKGTLSYFKTSSYTYY